jgi:hypothetical protein
MIYGLKRRLLLLYILLLHPLVRGRDIKAQGTELLEV